MGFPDQALSQATDARTNAPTPLVDAATAQADGSVARLRAVWSQMPSIPKFLPSREHGVDNSWTSMDVRTLLHGEDSCGRYSFHSIVLAPGAGLPAHTYSLGDTYWFVLEGEVVVTVGSSTQTLGPSGFAFAPEQTTQAIANRSSRRAQVYVAHSPAGADRAFAAAHALWLKSPAAPAAAFSAELEKHGFRFAEGQTQPNDSRVNTPAARVDEQVGTLDDYVALRGRWAALPPTPKIVASPQSCVNIPVPNQETRLLLSPEESRAAASVFYLGVEQGFGAPPHHQPLEEEFFVVLKGPLHMTIGTETVIAATGAFGFAPRFGTHAFKNTWPERAELISMNSPGGHDRGFEVGAREMGSERFPALIAAHGFQFHGAE
jgi:mannose-6-phosphate isomerase-like protein (cupin superfamily)